METQHPTLLIGPSDWDERRAPRAAYEQRIAALWAACPDASQAIVFGSAARHAELAYLTHFTPKLEPGIALLARDGRHRLLFGGGPNMIGAMAPLTFIADMAPLNALPRLIEGWRAPLLIGGGAMTRPLRQSIDQATGSTARDATDKLRAMMRAKSPLELAAIRAACAALAQAMDAIRAAVRSGAGATAALIAGERAAVAAGAQDVRTLYGIDATLRPFERQDDRPATQLYVAVRLSNYWAEGFAAVTPSPSAQASQERLAAAIAAGRPGMSLASLSKLLAGPDAPHPVIADAPIAALGLSLDEPLPQTCMVGDVLSLRSGSGDGAIASAMVAISDHGAAVLWRATVA